MQRAEIQGRIDEINGRMFALSGCFITDIQPYLLELGFTVHISKGEADYDMMRLAAGPNAVLVTGDSDGLSKGAFSLARFC